MDYKVLNLKKMKDEKIIKLFYDAFQNFDAESMIACYHQEIKFEDPAFGVLKGEEAKNMWRMLCKSLKEQKGKIIFSTIESDGTKGTANWEAYYTFSITGQKIHNIIKAEFEFKDGLIIKHTDTFNLYKWSKQAFGLKGVLIGWTPFFKKKLNSQTNKLLTKFSNRPPIN